MLNIIDTLTAKGVTLISHKEKIDTDTPAGNFMLTVFVAFSQLEREQLKQRQREGIESTKAQGKYTGRKPIEIDWTRFGQLYEKWKSKSITGRDFMRRMGLSANTFYRRVREYEAEHGITRDYLCLKATSGERKRPSEPSEPAERKTYRLKRKDLRSACVSKSQVFVSYSVPKGYAVIVAHAIMMIWTCTERFAGVPIDYGQVAHINIVP